MPRPFLGLFAALWWLGASPAVAAAIDPVNRGAITRIIVDPACTEGSETPEQARRCRPDPAGPSVAGTFGDVLLRIIVCLVPLIVGLAVSLLAQKRSGLERLSRTPILIGLTGSMLVAVVIIASWQSG